ncbi:MAG: hypothetical protein OHK0046_35690 [Anaerolineae bacterium]
MGTITRRIFTGFLLIALLITPFQSVFAQQDDDMVTVTIDGQRVQISAVDLEALEEAVEAARRVVERLIAIDYQNDFLKERCFGIGILEECFPWPDKNKPGWDELGIVLDDAVIVMENLQLVVESIPVVDAVVGDRVDNATTIVKSLRDVYRGVVLPLINVIGSAEVASMSAPQDILDDAQTAINFLDDVIDFRELLNALLGDVEAYIVQIANPEVELALNGIPQLKFENIDNYVYVEIYIGTPDFSQSFYQNWIQINCTVNCVVTPPAGLMNGDFVMFFRGWDGAVVSEWFGPFNFSINQPAPTVANVLTVEVSKEAENVVLIWQPAPNATWYQVWVGTPGPEFSTRYQNWHFAGDLTCVTDESCVLPVPNTLFGEGNNYTWWIQAWGPGGISTDAVSGWQEMTTFSFP